MADINETLDLADPALYVHDDIEMIFYSLRESTPVHWNPPRIEPGFWSVTRHADCMRVQKDTEAFSSETTNVLGPHRVAGDQGAGKMINATDPPRHTELRKLVNRCFTARAVSSMETYLRSVVANSLEAALAAGTCDFTKVVAPLPVAGITALLGVSRADWELMLRLTTTAFGSLDSEYQTTRDARANAAQAHGQLLLYCRQLLEQRRQRPGDDIVSLLAQAQSEGTLSEEECLLFFDLLMLGGNETTRHGAVGALLALARFPDQWRRLLDDPRLIPRAVDEVLRWTSPSRHVLRRARRDVELRGKTIRAGDDVVIWHMSANRDPRAFTDPDVFDVGRVSRAHIAFGSGPHFCLGAALATLELRVFLEELIGRVADAEILAPPERLRSTVINGVKHLHVRLSPRPGRGDGAPPALSPPIPSAIA